MKTAVTAAADEDATVLLLLFTASDALMIISFGELCSYSFSKQGGFSEQIAAISRSSKCLCVCLCEKKTESGEKCKLCWSCQLAFGDFLIIENYKSETRWVR